MNYPEYDVKALQSNVRKCDDNIELFEKVMERESHSAHETRELMNNAEQKFEQIVLKDRLDKINNSIEHYKDIIVKEGKQKRELIELVNLCSKRDAIRIAQQHQNNP